jgi:hypothetical protein
MKIYLTNEELETAIDDYLHKIMPNRYNRKSELDLYVITNNVASGGELESEQAIDGITVYNVEIE